MAGAVLSAHEREEIRVGIEVEESLSDIARRLGRCPSTITREVKRNGGRSSYCAVAAQGQGERLRSRPRDTTFQANPELARHVEDRLRAKDSPTTIAIELARAGGIGGDTVSPETIYQGVYAHGTRGLPRGWVPPAPQARPTPATLSSRGNTDESRPPGDVQPDPPASRGGEYPHRGRSLRGRPHHRGSGQVSHRHPHRPGQPTESARRPARWLRRRERAGVLH